MLKLVGYTNDQIATFSHDDNYYYISGDGTLPLNYTILNTFNKKKRDNSVALQIDFAWNTLFASTSFKFLKDVQSGNNGTKYSGIITYNGYCYGEQDAQGKIRKLQFVYINGSNTWYQYDITNERLISFNRPELKVEIYADGDKVTDSSRYNLEWEMFDESVSSSGCSNNTNETCFSIGKINSNISQIRYKDPAIYWTDNTKIYTNIVGAIVTILDNSSLFRNTIYLLSYWYSMPSK